MCIIWATYASILHNNNVSCLTDLCLWLCQLAGAVIGKGGNRIKTIQAESGTMIKLDEADVEGDERVISITGYPDEIQYAQQLLQQAWVQLLLLTLLFLIYI